MRTSRTIAVELSRNLATGTLVTVGVVYWYLPQLIEFDSHSACHEASVSEDDVDDVKNVVTPELARPEGVRTSKRLWTSDK
jgi:hypothetical protein